MKGSVITADLVNSSGMSFDQKDRLLESIRQRLLQLQSSGILTSSQLYRGDSFQCLLRNPVNGLRAALILKTYIKSLDPATLRSSPVKHSASGLIFIDKMFDVRVSVGMGEVINNITDPGLSDGEAFQLSGRKLDEMKKQKLTFAISTDDIYKEELITLSALLDFIISKTTALQCEVITFKLAGLTEVDIAERLAVHQSAVNQRAAAAGWSAIENAVKRFETIYSNG